MKSCLCRNNNFFSWNLEFNFFFGKLQLSYEFKDTEQFICVGRQNQGLLDKHKHVKEQNIYMSNRANAE